MTTTSRILEDSPTAGTSAVPEPGQVVEVRGSTWAVSNVRAQGLPRSPADESRAETHHVVSLQSLDEDRLGEELDVVWELEVGNTVAPDQGLPEVITSEGFDDPQTLAAFVDAVRWGAVTSADAKAFQSPFRSGANVEAYQLEPLRRALQAPRANLLLADDVGLGKTIEAGMVIQELLLRHRARTVIIVCPPSLSLKWQDEMREKFGLEFTIVNSELMAEVRRTHGLNANPFQLFPRVIVSMAWLPSLRAQRLLRAVYSQVRSVASARRYAFDILVVDEAHHVAPSSPSAATGGRGYAVDSQRTLATRDLAEKCEHRLFLSATPHNGHSESFTALLEMIDNRRFARGATIDKEALKEVAVRRLKSEIPGKDFKARMVKPIPFTPSADEQDAFERLTEVLRNSAKRNARGRSGDLVAMLLKKRFLSSPWAFATTMQLYTEATATGRLPDLDDEDNYYEEVLGSDQSDEEEGQEEHPEFTALRKSRGSDPLSAATTQQVKELAAWGQTYQHQPDSRLTKLLAFLDAICRPDGRTWTNERVVVFTEYATTLEWMVGILEQKGYGPKMGVIQGSTPAEERELIRARFNEHPSKEPIRVLLATDSAGEGIDLQGYCHRLVNFDIPFNPSRLEQRIGRIDRYGQTTTPEVYHFVPDEDSTTFGADMDFLQRVARKVATISADLGAVNQVIDEEIQSHFGFSGARSRKARRSKDAEVITRTLAGEVNLNRQLTDLARTYEDRKEQMHLTPWNARRVVDTALTVTSQPTLRDVGDPDTDAQVFTVPALGKAWHTATIGLATRLHPDQPRPVTFDDAAARGRSDLVYVHLGHPLLQKAARTLRGSLFSTGTRINRVTAVVVEDIPQSCVAAVSRLVLVGRGGMRLHEEVFLTGIRIRGQAMAEAKVEDLLERTFDATDLTLAPSAVRATLAAEWNGPDSRLRHRLEAAMRRRADDRQQAVTERLAARRETDLTRAREIFAAFRTNLHTSLAELRSAEEEAASMLFPDDQQKQRHRDIRRMEDRLEGLDQEEQRELATIRERYADVQPHVAAAAVVFALTPQDARQGAVN